MLILLGLLRKPKGLKCSITCHFSWCSVLGILHESNDCYLMDRFFPSLLLDALSASTSFLTCLRLFPSFFFFLDSFGLWQVLAYTVNLFPVILEIFLKQLLPKALRCLPVSLVNSSLIKVEIHVTCSHQRAKSSLPLNCRCSMIRVYLAAELSC